MDARTRRREPKGIPIGGRFARGGTGADASDLTGPASGRMTRAAVEARARWLSANSDIAAYDADVERWNGQMAEYVAERQAIRDGRTPARSTRRAGRRNGPGPFGRGRHR